ncbi:ATP-binding protein [Amycolatopsis orientalis]|uniref:ATP-binding protein n=1 Tax=Amycolatopsis orientalis TaxID=31958 RepID=UPI0004220196|nr:ATP-binding protein [Amycolatopsis orientalis]
MMEHFPDELRRLLTQWQDNPAAELLDELGLDSRTLCRVSLLPEWTPELAVRLHLTGPGELPGLVERLVEADLIERRASRTAAGDAPGPFWIRTRRRREVGDYLRDKLGVQRLQAEYNLFCGEVSKLDHDGLGVWLLVRRFYSDPTGALLLDCVEGFLRERDLAAAASTVATTRVVSDVIGGTLEDAVKRAQWRLDREYRTKDDLGHLSGYHRRSEIEDVLEELIHGRDGKWAAHLLGNAGVGKTMAIRYLASGKLAGDRGLGRFPVARVDFDHLDPRYPERRPGELLLAMTDELLGFATTRDAEHRYRAVRDAADALHEELSRSFPDPVRAERLRLEAIERFADFVRRLPAPVVLVLDTCEELAKLYAPGAQAPAIDQTFDLVERLHDQVPSVRVLFAGRRKLVSAPGDGPHGGPSLKPREHVRIVPMCGFTRSDAEGYLAEREVPVEVWPALLDRSLEDGRYNPFELAGLCDWVRDEPALDLAGLTGKDKDPYVERRILARIQDRQVNSALPVAAAFGEFDRDLITPALTRARVDVKAAFDGLAAQEWVNVRKLGRDGMPSVLEIDEHIRERLRAVLDRSPERPSPDPHALGRDAAAVIKQKPFSEVATETVVAAVRLLPPEEAADLWRWLDDAIVSRREWAWAEGVAARVAAMEQARVTSGGPTILAAVLATAAAARVHNGHRDGLERLWSGVEEHAARMPGKGSAALQVRARLGQISVDESDDLPDHVASFLDLCLIDDSTVPADSMVAAVENLITRPASPVFFLLLREVLERLIERAQPRLAAAAAILLAGLWLRRDVERPVLDDLERATNRLQECLRDEDRNLWDPPEYADWVVPRGLLERLRLMRVLIALYGGEPLPETEWRAWSGELRLAGDDIDADRLRAALLDHRLASTVDVAIPHLRLEPLSGRPLSWLHNGFGRPLVVAIADAMGMRGDYDRAAELLERQRRLAVAAGDQAELIESCDLALLRLCRQEGTQRHAHVRSLAYEGTPRLRDEACLVLRLSGNIVGDWRELCTPFGRWRCDPRGTPPARDEADRWATDHLDHWEAESLGLPPPVSRLPVDGPLASGRASLMAGEIHAKLGHVEESWRLLENAEEAFSSCGFPEGIDRARALRMPSVEVAQASSKRARRRRWTPEVVRLFAAFLSYTVGAYVHRCRRWVAGHTGRQMSFVLLMCLALGVIASVFSAVSGGSAGWVIGLGLGVAVVMALSRVGAADMEFTVRRLEIRRQGPDSLAADYLLTGYPGRELAKLAEEPKKDRERKYLATPLWSEVYQPDIEPPFPEGVVDLLVDLMIPTTTAIVLLEIPREDQFAFPWENDLGQGMPTKDLPRVVWTRWLPGPVAEPGVLTRPAGGKLLHAPVSLWPGPVWNEDMPGFKRLVHVVGTPVRSSAGWQFRVRDTFGEASRASSRGSNSREDLLDLYSLTKDPVALVVLQAEPVDGPPTPLGRAREPFVRAATAAMDKAVDAVLVIPPLPDRLARDAVEMIWRAANRFEGTTGPALFSLVADLKTMVYKADRVGTDSPYACLDVLFFLRDKRKGTS